MKRFITVFLLYFAYLLPSKGIYLEDIDALDLVYKRVAYYPGSFDPFHLGHATVVNTILNKNLAEYVLIYPLPNSDSSKERTPFKFRFAMIESLYKNHPQVIITKLTPLEMQKKFLPYMGPKCGYGDIIFSVVIGSDVVKQYVNTSQYDHLWMQGVPIEKTLPKEANTSLGAIVAILADYVIAFNREGEDVSSLGKSYKNRNLIVRTAPLNADISSTKVRDAVKTGENISLLVPHSVEKIINENNLYKLKR